MRFDYIDEKLKFKDIWDIEEYIKEKILNKFDDNDTEAEALKELTLYIHEYYPELLEKTIENILYYLSRYFPDKREYYLDAFFGWFCEDLEDAISESEIAKKIGGIIWDNIKNETENEIRYGIGEERYNKLATVYDKNFWIRKLENDEYIRIQDAYKELFKTNEEKLLPFADKIAEEIDYAWDMVIGQKDKQRKILEYLEKIEYYKLLDEILKSDKLRYWDHNTYNVSKLKDEIRKQERRDRISVDEARKIIEENGLQDRLKVVEGYAGTEDMKFDYIIDRKTNEIISEDDVFKYLKNGVEISEPWIKDRDFGDKKMRRSWFMHIIEKYKNKV